MTDDAIAIVRAAQRYLRGVGRHARSLQQADALDAVVAEIADMQYRLGDPRDVPIDTGDAEVNRVLSRLSSADPDFPDIQDAAALLRRMAYMLDARLDAARDAQFDVLWKIRQAVEQIPGALMHDKLVERVRTIVSERDTYHAALRDIVQLDVDPQDPVDCRAMRDPDVDMAILWAMHDRARLALADSGQMRMPEPTEDDA